MLRLGRSVGALGTGLVTVGCLLAAAPLSRAASLRCAPRHLDRSAAVGGSQLTVSPLPGSLDASAHTQISLVGAPVSDLLEVSVSGSRSGSHRGRLRAYSQGDGASFVSGTRFRPGERVSVQVRLRQGASVRVLRWRFSVSRRAVGHADRARGARTRRSSADQRFRSEPGLRPPRVTVTRRSAASAAGDMFIAPYSGPEQSGPMILDPSGRMVWFHPLGRGARVANFGVQRYLGMPVLTWFEDGANVIFDASYRAVARVRAGNGYHADLHDFQITPQGTALITVYDTIRCDLSSIGGSRRAAVRDGLVQEVDVRTGLVRFEWHGLDHVGLWESYASARGLSPRVAYDPWHLNSINVNRDGSLMISARDTWAIYDLDRRTGRIRWRLGGKRSSFHMGRETRTAWQHDAREPSDGTISVFDNGAVPRVHAQSRGIVVALDTRHRRVRLLARFEHHRSLVAGSQGNLQALPNGDWFAGWGQVPYFSEFSPRGRLLFDAHLPAAERSYRAYRFAWVGSPRTPPAIAVQREPGGLVHVYASWNGATEVARWEVVGGPSAATLTPVASAPRDGFETVLDAHTAAPLIAVRAMNATGQVLGVSRTVSG